MTAIGQSRGQVYVSVRERTEFQCGVGKPTVSARGGRGEPPGEGAVRAGGGTMKRVPQARGRVRKEVEGEVRKGRGSCAQETARINGEPRQGPEERPGTLSLVSGTG